MIRFDTPSYSLLTRRLFAAGVLLAATSAPSSADDQAPRAENGDPLIVRDVGVYLLSAYGTKLNERELFQSTLPNYTLSRRPTTSREGANRPAPLAVMTMTGPAEGDIDVLLEFEQGRFLAHWPPARMRSKRLLWPSIDLAEQSPISPTSMPESHWLLPLREAERLYFVGNKQADRFLLYDAELPYAPHVTLARATEGDGYIVTNTGKYPVHDISVYRPVEQGLWEVATSPVVEAAGKGASDEEKTSSDSSPPPEESAASTTDAAEKEASATEAVAAAAVAALAAAPVAASPAEVPAAVPQPAEGAENQPEQDKPQPKPGATAPASIVGQVSADQAMQAWRTSLGAMNLEAPEIEFLISILREQALRSDSAMLVYRLDETQLEQLLPLEVTPYPDRLFRVALVIVQDADPDLQSEVESLIARLGHDEWKQREAAQKELAELGLAAKPKLEAALKHKDAEIVFRAEQLLEALKAAPVP